MTDDQQIGDEMGLDNIVNGRTHAIAGARLDRLLTPPSLVIRSILLVLGFLLGNGWNAEIASLLSGFGFAMLLAFPLSSIVGFLSYFVLFAGKDHSHVRHMLEFALCVGVAVLVLHPVWVLVRSRARSKRAAGHFRPGTLGD